MAVQYDGGPTEATPEGTERVSVAGTSVRAHPPGRRTGGSDSAGLDLGIRREAERGFEAEPKMLPLNGRLHMRATCLFLGVLIALAFATPPALAGPGEDAAAPRKAAPGPRMAKEVETLKKEKAA